MDAQSFKSDACALISQLLPARDAQRYASYALLNRQQPGYFQNTAAGFSRYADVLGESLLRNLQARIESVIGAALLPCYSLLRIYSEQAAFSDHADDPQSEFVALLSLDGSAGNLWSLQVNGLAEALDLSAGDALIYTRAEVNPTRAILTADHRVELALHYVAAKGDFAHRRFDGRRGLGEPQNRLQQDRNIKQRPAFDAALAAGNDQPCFCHSGQHYSVCHGQTLQVLKA